MWIRTIKVTFANELMKKSVRSYCLGQHRRVFRATCYLQCGPCRKRGFSKPDFPDKGTLDAFEKTMKHERDQLKSMGAKVEINDGPVWSFKVAGDITLDTLTKGVSPR